MKRVGVLLCVMILVFGLTGMASALTLSSVDGDWTGWASTDPSSGPYVSYDSGVPIGYGNGSEDQIRWGLPAESEKSGLGFTGAAPPDSVFDIGDAFEIGQLRHFNNPIYYAIDEAYLTISLSFSDPAGLNGSFDFTFGINETPNNTGNPYLDRDFISFPGSYAAETFVIGGVEYTLQLLGFGDDPGSLLDQFESNEGGTNATRLWGRITTPEGVIPEPGTVLLLGSGLLGLLALKRKRR